MKRKMISGYSQQVVNRYLDLAKPIYCLSMDLAPQYEWKDSRPTDNVVAYRGWFTQEGADAFSVKFTSEIKLPKYLAKVEFDGLEACEVRNNVYFRAKSIKEAK
ncbi:MULTISPECIES: hypothetical protein [unclassified Lactobacillus]|uniref:hypothetical protein n=1 Tax=unclassified Lactobacillus TaxID=2620435 RepID=UPI002269F165|nr:MULTISPECIES: hypothetical protein [unclassified Lactobacillus]MCX8720380.1 hypothetical protein [Lactobacillus sp. B4010]MCX8732801.1 hypothetical protein [Lactobacillus sp. B4015]MCX8735146.1 hypothetical protein [Lactobacillus sp. B4012]